MADMTGELPTVDPGPINPPPEAKPPAETTLAQKLDNLEKFIAGITTEKADKIMHKFQEQNVWFGRWQDSYSIECAKPLMEKYTEICQALTAIDGDFSVSFGFRRSGKTTSAPEFRISVSLNCHRESRAKRGAWRSRCIPK